MTALVRDAAARAAQGRELQLTIRAQHCGAGWLARLEEIKKLIPDCHGLRPHFQPIGVAPEACAWFLKSLFSNQGVPTAAALAEHWFIEAWRRTGVRPGVTPSLWTELCALAEERVSAAGQPCEPSLKQLNQQIKVRGEGSRTLDAIRVDLCAGRTAAARRLLYRRLLTQPRDFMKTTWLRPLIKAHLGEVWSRRLRSISHRLATLKW